ncbi:MAG TPA: glycosyl transferase, partial [Solirubrobacterales bacterium]|nr:glycosyl transferase [Solirubrobacterales bacterium]
RITWAEVGRSIRWSLTGPRSLRWAVAEILSDPVYRSRAGEVADWQRRHDGPARGAELVEALTASGKS